MICNDLNNYVISKGYSKKLDKSLYALSDANGKPVEDVTKATGWGNCGYNEGWANDYATTRYYLNRETLEQARESYKKELRSQIDFDTSFLAKTYNHSFATYKFNVVIYKDVGNAVQRLDLQRKYNIPVYTMVLCYL